MRLSFSLASMFLLLLSGGTVRAEKVLVSGCGDGRYDPVPALTPINSGPLKLAKIYCLKLPSSAFPVSPPRISPDESNAFVFDSIKGLSIASTGPQGSLQHFDGRITVLMPFSGSVPFTWSLDPRSLFGVRQETQKNGFAVGPLSPVLFHIDGTSEQLPELNNPAGPLDEMYWIGNAGIAVAAFGTHGGYYRPEHVDPHPTIALVDAHAGRVLHAIAIADIPGAGPKTQINRVASDADGRRVLISLSPNLWVLWALASEPKVVPIGVKSWLTPYALSPGGKSVLVMKGLSATGIICEHNPRCPAPTPQSGVIAELHDLPSGKVLWTVSGTAEKFSGSLVPAISRDGKYALISMPDGSVALLSMKDGAVLQRVPVPWTSECSMGFSANGKMAWISGGSRIIFYKLAA